MLGYGSLSPLRSTVIPSPAGLPVLVSASLGSLYFVKQLCCSLVTTVIRCDALVLVVWKQWRRGKSVAGGSERWRGARGQWSMFRAAGQMASSGAGGSSMLGDHGRTYLVQSLRVYAPQAILTRAIK